MRQEGNKERVGGLTEDFPLMGVFVVKTPTISTFTNREGKSRKSSMHTLNTKFHCRNNSWIFLIPIELNANKKE